MKLNELFNEAEAPRGFLAGLKHGWTRSQDSEFSQSPRAAASKKVKSSPLELLDNSEWRAIIQDMLQGKPVNLTASQSARLDRILRQL
jgi:hypothetical protein